MSADSLFQPLDERQARGGGPRDEVVLVTGISGSGKSVALHALEDGGYFCVDNLPPELLHQFVRLERERFTRNVAVAVDVRTATSLPVLLPAIEVLRGEGVQVRLLFLEASTEALVRRYSETRRPHPLTAPHEADNARALMEAIELERQLLADLRDVATVIDTSQLRPAVLRKWIRQLVGAGESALTLVFESFAFKHGVPLDADFVFDVRVLPNPYYVRELRALTGRDAAVAQWLSGHAEVGEMVTQIQRFIERWLPNFEDDQRSYLTVAVGCTGGQHRSVHAVEVLARQFRGRTTTLVRHRELDGAA
jgi:RNase adapter protein RapZ